MSPSQAHGFIVAAWGEDAVSLRTIQRWYKEFCEGTRTTLEDANRSGRPRSSRTEANMEIVEQYLTEWLNALATHLPPTSVYRILTDDLGLTWRLAKWIPFQLTVNQKDERVAEARNILRFLKTKTAERRWVVIDEKIVYHKTIGTKQSNAQWLPHDVTPPKISRRTQFDAKSMIIVAVSFTGKHCVEVLKRGDTVNSESYIQFLRHVHHNFHRHECSLKWNDMVIMHDNARPYVRCGPQFPGEKGSCYSSTAASFTGHESV